MPVGLKLGTEYEMIVVAINARGENDVKMKAVKAMTSGTRPVSSTIFVTWYVNVMFLDCDRIFHDALGIAARKN